MEITEVRIKLMDNAEDRLRGFCSVTFDDSFVVRDLKIIDGNNGPFVAMPSRRLTSHCRVCNTKNHLKARFCNHCGKRLSADLIETDENGRARLYADIAHPVNAKCREMIQQAVIGEFHEELERSREPGYISRYDDDYDDRPRRRPAVTRHADSRESPDMDAPHPLEAPHFIRGSNGEERQHIDSDRPKESGDSGNEPGEPSSSALPSNNAVPATRSDFGKGAF